jgi:hypothetical protein
MTLKHKPLALSRRPVSVGCLLLVLVCAAAPLHAQDKKATTRATRPAGAEAEAASSLTNATAAAVSAAAAVVSATNNTPAVPASVLLPPMAPDPAQNDAASPPRTPLLARRAKKPRP